MDDDKGILVGQLLLGQAFYKLCGDEVSGDGGLEPTLELKTVA